MMKIFLFALASDGVYCKSYHKYVTCHTVTLLSHAYLTAHHNNIFISLPVSHPVTDNRGLDTWVFLLLSGNLLIVFETTSYK